VSRRRLLCVVAVVLLAEAAALVALPGKLPRATRTLGAATNVIAAAAILLFVRQNRPGK
jgi:hypothetical protein